MKNQIISKLKSNKGASLVLALLLFTICISAGAVILVSASEVSGRFKDLNESDARYYSVKSAADLIREELDGYEYVITRTCTRVDTTTITAISVETNTGTGKISSSIPKYTYDVKVKKNNAYVTTNPPILRNESLNLVFGTTTGIDDKVEASISGSITPSFPRWDFAMNVEAPSGTLVDYLGVSVAAITTSGGIEFQIVSADKAFTITESFAFARTDSGQTYSYDNKSIENRDYDTSSGKLKTYDEVQTTTTVTTKVSEIAWSYVGMK